MTDQTATDRVGAHLQQFYSDEDRSYKASTLDAVIVVAKALYEEGFSDEITPHDINTAADVMHIFGCYGYDYIESLVVHAVVASILLQTEDVW